MADSKIYTLWDLLQNSVDTFENKIPEGIEIPMIQRDYAQGRRDVKTIKIRKKFLEDIHRQLMVVQNNLENVEPLELDFVYGYILGDKFIPLDGQQRLTTLYLIHWYLFFKERRMVEHLDAFTKLSYCSRVSSREFFECLNRQVNIDQLYHDIDDKSDRGESWSLPDLIEDQSWFLERWKYDPTLQSVMTMLSEIASMFNGIKSETLIDQRPIGFYIIDIPENGKGDSLYIKMNARGKGLTDFENLKAILEGKIRAVSVELHEKFSHAIDRGWLDKVWLLSNGVRLTEERSKASGAYLLSLLRAVSELLFYKNSEDGLGYVFSEELMLEIYGEKDSIRFLIESMEHICSRDLDSYDGYFSEIYAQAGNTQDRVRHKGKVNVIQAYLEGISVEAIDKLLFFAWLIYINRKGDMQIDDNMRDYLRICRNYLNNINQKNRKAFNLTSEIRNEDFRKILSVFTAVYHPTDVYGSLAGSTAGSEKYIGYEQIKHQRFSCDSAMKSLIHRLEDNMVFRGLLFNIDLEKYDYLELSFIVEDFLALMDSKNTAEIIRLLISLGYMGTHIANTSIGEMRLWGRADRWHRVMASPDGEIKKPLSQLFELFISRDRNIDISQFCKEYWLGVKETQAKESLIWYLLEYPAMISKAIFTIDKIGWKVPTMELFDVTALMGYHCNPFVLELRSRTDVVKFIDLPQSYAQYSNLARVWLKNSLSLSQANYSWVVHGLESMEDFSAFKQAFNLESLQNAEYRFCCENLVEDVIPFIEACSQLVVGAEAGLNHLELGGNV